MVKRILALSLLMVGLAACGGGGGATAEADTLNVTPEPTCQCIVYMPSTNLILNSGWQKISSDLCNPENKYFSSPYSGCASYEELCNLVSKDWSFYTNAGADVSSYNLQVSCQ